MNTRVKLSSWNPSDNLLFENIVNHGAVGDGTTDDTAALVAALFTGLPVFIPTGTFVINGIQPATTATIFGSGPLSILKVKDASNAAGLYMNNSAGVTLQNLSIDGNKANQTGTSAHGVFVSNSSVLLQNVYIYNTLGDGVHVEGAAASCLLDNVQVNGFVRNGFCVESGTRISLSNCQAYSSDAAAFPGDGFALSPVNGGTSVTSITITNCRSSQNVGRGFAFIGYGSKNVYNVLARGCVATSNTVHGFHTTTVQRVRITESLAWANGGDGFRLEGDSQYNSVSGIADSNTGYGFREVVSGSTPDYNKTPGLVTAGNGNNTITFVGTHSSAPF